LYNDGCGGRIAHRREWVSGWVDEWVGVPEERTRDEKGVKKKTKISDEKKFSDRMTDPRSQRYGDNRHPCVEVWGEGVEGLNSNTKKLNRFKKNS